MTLIILKVSHISGGDKFEERTSVRQGTVLGICLGTKDLMK